MAISERRRELKRRRQRREKRMKTRPRPARVVGAKARGGSDQEDDPPKDRDGEEEKAS